MVLIFDCTLTEPPSSVHCFRDVTLYSKVFLDFDNIIRCPKGTKSMYWSWIKKYGAHDFVEQLIKEGEDQSGFTIGKKCKINFDTISEYNYNELINILNKLKFRK